MSGMLIFNNHEVFIEITSTLIMLLICAIVYAVVKGYVENKRWEKNVYKKLEKYRGKYGVDESCEHIFERDQIMSDKKIIIGEIKEQYNNTPINIFKKAVEISKQHSFEVHTNNPQLVEALEVLCGEDNINIFLKRENSELEEMNILEAYDYLGDVYDIIDYLRCYKLLEENINDNVFEEQISKYEKKWKVKL